MFAESQVFTFGSQVSPQKSKKEETREACLPVTVKMLHEAGSENESAYLSNGREESMLILAGQVEAVTSGAASVEFTLCMCPALEAARAQLSEAGVWTQAEGYLVQKSGDAANKVKVRKYITDIAQGVPAVAEGQFVVVTGHLRKMPELHFSAEFLNITSDTKRLGFHVIEALHAMLRITRGPPPKPTGLGLFASPEKPRPVASPQVPVSNPATGAGSASPAAAASIPAGAGKIHEQVLSFLKEHSEDVKGFTAADLVQKLGCSSEAELKSCLTSLMNDGEIFNTIDDEHYSAL